MIHISAMNGFVLMIFELDLITLEKFICDKMVVVNLKIFFGNTDGTCLVIE